MVDGVVEQCRANFAREPLSALVYYGGLLMHQCPIVCHCKQKPHFLVWAMAFFIILLALSDLKVVD